MKAVIAVPPILDFYFTPTRASALGAAAVEEICRSRGIETVLLNFPMLGKKPVRQELPRELSYLDDFLMPGESGPLSFFTGYRRFGPPVHDCALRILEQKPDIVFLSLFAWAYAEEAILLASQLKSMAKNLPIAAGGAGISVNPGYFADSGCIDHLLPGEAERVLPAFLDTASGKAGGPCPSDAQDDTPGFYIRETGASRSRKIRYYSAVLSRGCPKSCRFCSNRLVHGTRFRKASPDEINEKIETLPNDCNIHINFEDDNLLLARDFFFGVLDTIKRRFPEATFSAENGLDYTLLDGDLVSMLTKSGFRSFNFSMASADQYLLTREKRTSDPERLRDILQSAANAGATSTTYFICGLEGDSTASAVNNLAVLHKLPTLTGISMFYPVPGLPGFDAGRMSAFAPRLCAGSSAWPWTGSLSTSEMITAFRLARLSNLIKTVNGIIPEGSGLLRKIPAETLIDRITETRRLYSLVGNELQEVPNQSTGMVGTFLESIKLG